MTEAGRKTLIALEGLKLRVYLDIGGKPTIGVGHLITKEELESGRFAKGITVDQAMALLEADIAPAADAVQRLVKAAIDPQRIDALTIFAFNVGVRAFQQSTLLKKLNAGEPDRVPGELRKWVFDNRVKSNGLVNRREAEIQLWSTPEKTA